MVNEIIEFFIAPYREVSAIDITIEIVVFLCGIWSIWLAKNVKIAAFPIGLIATSLTAYLLFKIGFLAEMSLNIYFSLMGIYGWYNWSKGSNQGELPISRTTKKEKLTGLGFFFLTILVTFVVYALFGAEIAWANWLDIFLSGIFFTAMWFMALKKIENWTLYIVADALATPLYAHRGLGILAIQYLIFTILAIIAYLEWRKQLEIQPQK